jgi:hypothetical protein
MIDDFYLDFAPTVRRLLGLSIVNLSCICMGAVLYSERVHWLDMWETRWVVLHVVGQASPPPPRGWGGGSLQGR